MLSLPNHENRSEDGFTLIELLVVIIIIGILAAIAIPAFLNFQKDARAATVQSDVRNTVAEAALYATKNGPTAAMNSEETHGTAQSGPVEIITSSGNKVTVTGTGASYTVTGVNADGFTWKYDSSSESYAEVPSEGVVSADLNAAAPAVPASYSTLTERTDFNDSPNGNMAVRNGNIYYGYSTVQSYNTSNGATSTVATGFTQIRGIVVDASGNLYVTDNNAVKKITPAGAVSTIASVDSASGIAIRGGYLYVGSSSGLYKVSVDGTKTKINDIPHIWDMAWTSDGFYYVSALQQTQVRKLASETSTETPQTLYTAPGGWVTDMVGAGNSVYFAVGTQPYLYKATNTTVAEQTQLSSGAVSIINPNTVALGNDGKLYIKDAYSSRIKIAS